MVPSFLASMFASALVLFLWGGVVYAGFLRSFFPRHFAAIARHKDDAQRRLWAVALEKVLQGLVLTLMFRLCAHGGAAPWREGIVFGALVGALVEVTWFFGVWTSFKVRAVAVAVPVALGFARFVAVGAIIGALNG